MEKHIRDIRALDLRDVIMFNVNCLEFFGYFRPEIKRSLYVVMYYIYAVLFVGFIFIAYVASELTNIILVFGDIEKMTEASFLFLTHIVQLFKLHIFLTRRSDVRNLINSISREEFKPRNTKQYNILVKDIKFSRMITKIFLFMGFATCMLWGIFPYLDKKEDISVRLPLSGWFPFNIEKRSVFRSIYIYQTIGALINGLANISMDTFLSGIIMVISGQLNLLNNSLQIMRTDNENGLKSFESAKVTLIRNIIHYRNILQFANEVTSIFTNCIMGQFVVSVIIICITMFQMSLVSVMSLQFLSMALYQGCMVLEIFLWCYFGNEVILQSEKLTESAYTCRWFDSSKEFKKDLVFFMIRSQVPLKLYAGGYFTLSLDTFKAIVKSSWSYFAVLNQVHSDKVI